MISRHTSRATPHLFRWALAASFVLLLVPMPARAATANAGSDETTALGRPVTLDGSASIAAPGATYAWAFGDGGTSSSAKPTVSHNYRFAGRYTARLTVTDSGGSSSDTATVSVRMRATNIDYSRFPADRKDYFTESAATRYVALNGSNSNPGTKARPYRTIQYAISRATSGTVILVRGGHYFSGDITLDKSNLVLAAYPMEKVVIETDRYDVWEHRNGLMLTGPIRNVVLDGFEIRHFTAQGVQFGDENTQRNIILKNLVVDDAEAGINTVYTADAPAREFIDGMLVKNVTLQHTTMMGFNAGQVGGGRQLYRNVRLDHVNALMNGLGDDTAADAFAFENGLNVVAESCVAQNVSGDGFDFKADKTAVVNSIARHIARNGVKLWNNGQIVNSLVYDTGADAGVVLDAGSFRIVNSAMAWHLKGQQGGAYSMSAGYDNPGFRSLEVFRSIFYQECDRFYVNNTGPGSLSVKENILYGFALNRILQYGSVDYETTAAINARPWGGGNVERNPAFADPANDDWRILSGSNGFVAPQLRPRPVVTVTNPKYPNPAGPYKPIKWIPDQAGTFSADVATNAVNGVGTPISSGWALKNVLRTTSVPVSAAPSGGGRIYVFLINSTSQIGWQSVNVDTYRPRTYAPLYSRPYYGTTVPLYYRVADPYSDRAAVKIWIRNSAGKYVRMLSAGWVPTGSQRSVSFQADLPRGQYTFHVYATDLALNKQHNVASNVLVVR